MSGAQASAAKNPSSAEMFEIDSSLPYSSNRKPSTARVSDSLLADTGISLNMRTFRCPAPGLTTASCAPRAVKRPDRPR